VQVSAGSVLVFRERRRMAVGGAQRNIRAMVAQCANASGTEKPRQVNGEKVVAAVNYVPRKRARVRTFRRGRVATRQRQQTEIQCEAV